MLRAPEVANLISTFLVAELGYTKVMAILYSADEAGWFGNASISTASTDTMWSTGTTVLLLIAFVNFACGFAIADNVLSFNG
mgnify:CR=1 FL=1